jgi:hypothetical protein
MTLGLPASYALLCLLQGALVAAPVGVRPRRRSVLVGLLVPVGALGLGVGLLRTAGASPEALADLAAVATPLLAGYAGWLFHWRRPWLAVVGVASLYLLAWQVDSLPGQVAAATMIGLACLTIACAVTQVAPRWSVAVGLVLLAAVDVALVWGTRQVDAATITLAGATPPTLRVPLLPDKPLPELQQATIGSASMGWLDLLAAALLCTVLSARARPRAAITVTIAAGLWGLLLFTTPLLPATVPVLAGLPFARPVWASAGAAGRGTLRRRIRALLLPRRREDESSVRAASSDGR